MGKNPDRIRREIEETRAQLDQERPADVMREEIDQTRAQIGETVGALGHKADVKGRIRQSVSQKKDAVVGTLSSGKNAVVGKADSLVSSVTGVVPDADQVKQGAEKVGVSPRNPIGLLIGGAAVGFLAGLAIPSTRMEDERIGDMADQVKDTVKQGGQEALDRGKQVAQEAVDSAKETAKERGQEQGEELTTSLKKSVKDVAPVGSSPTGR